MLPFALLLLAAAIAAAAAANAIFSGPKAIDSPAPDLGSGGDPNPASTKLDPDVEPPVRLVAAVIGGCIGRIGDPKPNWADAEKAAPKLKLDFFSLDLFSVFRTLLLFGGGGSAANRFDECSSV